MSWLSWLLLALVVWWLYFATFGGMQLYKDFGFVMTAIRSRDNKENPAPPYVTKVDTALAIPCVLRDGRYNAVVMPFLCLDFRPSYAFRKVKFRGHELWFFELTTERLSRYNEDASEWAYRRWVARTVAPFLQNKDPKGWHVRKPKLQG